MRKYELSEKDLRDLWVLARRAPHVSEKDITDKMKEIGFNSGFIENGHGGYWQMSTPEWLNLTRIAKSFLFVLGQKVVNWQTVPEETKRYINERYNKLKL